MSTCVIVRCFTLRPAAVAPIYSSQSGEVEPSMASGTMPGSITAATEPATVTWCATPHVRSLMTRSIAASTSVRPTHIPMSSSCAAVRSAETVSSVDAIPATSGFYLERVGKQVITKS